VKNVVADIFQLFLSICLYIYLNFVVINIFKLRTQVQIGDVGKILPVLSEDPGHVFV
jgi:hypothetical protein